MINLTDSCDKIYVEAVTTRLYKGVEPAPSLSSRSALEDLFLEDDLSARAVLHSIHNRLYAWVASPPRFGVVVCSYCSHAFHDLPRHEAWKCRALLPAILYPAIAVWRAGAEGPSPPGAQGAIRVVAGTVLCHDGVPSLALGVTAIPTAPQAPVTQASRWTVISVGGLAAQSNPQSHRPHSLQALLRVAVSAALAAPKPLDNLIASIPTSLAGRPLAWDPFTEVPGGFTNDRPGMALAAEVSLVLTCVMRATCWR